MTSMAEYRDWLAPRFLAGAAVVGAMVAAWAALLDGPAWPWQVAMALGCACAPALAWWISGPGALTRLIAGAATAGYAAVITTLIEAPSGRFGRDSRVQGMRGLAHWLNAVWLNGGAG